MTGRVHAGADEVARELEAHRSAGRRIVTTNGAFDMLHRGHRFLFRECRKLGDVLVVGVNSDSSVRALKNPSRPFEPAWKRTRKVAKFADFVFTFDELDPREWLRLVRPDVHVTAATYGPDCVEAGVVAELGAVLVLVPVRPELGSSTQRIKRARQWTAVAWVLLTVVFSPLLLLCARLRRPAQRVLLVPLSGIGDVVQVTPLLRALDRRFPAHEIHVLGSAAGRHIHGKHPCVDRVIDESGGPLSVIVDVWRQRYDVAITFERGPFLSSACVWAAACTRVDATPAGEGSRWWARLSTVSVPYVAGTSRFEHMLAVASALGAERFGYALEFVIESDARAAADAWLSMNGLNRRPYVVVNPSAGGPKKQWPIDRWAALIRRINDELRHPVVVSTAVRPHAAALCDGRQVLDASSLALEEAAVVYKRAACFVSVDTGPLYVAHAVGVPVVVIVGVVTPSENLPPEGPRVMYVAPPEVPRDRRLAETTVDGVFAAVSSMLRRSSTAEESGREVGADPVT